MKSEAYVMPSGEVLWPRTAVVRVLKDLAAAGLVILGFDIVVKGSRGPSVWGASAYEMGNDVCAGEWDDSVSVSLEHALRDVDRTQQLAGLTPPLDDVWYLIDVVDKDDAESLWRP